MLKLRDDYDVRVNLRVVFPIAVRNPELLFNPQNRNRTRYIMVDWVRRAQFLGMPHHWPSPDPVVQDMSTMKISEYQPYIHRLCSLGVEAQRRGKGIDFAAEVAALLFGGTKDWHLGDHLAGAAERAGLDLASMETSVEGTDHLEEVATNQSSLDRLGGWGVPSFVFNEELFFGQDRIDTLRWRLEQQGLRRT
jgi:2-hydroxychromene-2-carboxylate isomerase